MQSTFASPRVFAAAPEGVGLGLAIRRDPATGMSGELTVQSAPGERSTVCLRFPRAVQA